MCQAGGRGRALWSWNPDAQDRWATDCCPLTWVLTWKVVAVCWSGASSGSIRFVFFMIWSFGRVTNW